MGGIKGKLGGGDLSKTPHDMPYDEIMTCDDREASANLRQAKYKLPMGTEMMEMICNTPPDVDVAPLGIGFSFKTSDACSSVKQPYNNGDSIPVEGQCNGRYSGVR